MGNTPNFWCDGHLTNCVLDRVIVEGVVHQDFLVINAKFLCDGWKKIWMSRLDLEGDAWGIRCDTEQSVPRLFGTTVPSR